MFYKILYGLVAIPVPPYFERIMVSSCLQADQYFCQLLLLFILPNDGYSLEQVTSWSRPWFRSWLFQIRSQQDQPYTPLGIYCFYLVFKLFFLILTLSSMFTIILHFLCCTISLFLLLLTHHAQHIQIILVRGFWIMSRYIVNVVLSSTNPWIRNDFRIR